MATLKCSVEKCSYNSCGFCCKQDIAVSGMTAKQHSDTCCISYRDQHRREAYAVPDPITDVLCDAHNCVHNAKGRCGADNIRVCNCNNGCQGPEATECSTFCCR